MSKFEKLAYLNTLANDCAKDNDFSLASQFHSEFMKIAQNQSEQKVTVGAGDTLSTIAQGFNKMGYGCSVRKIMERNNLTSSVIQPGDQLIIPLTGNPPLKPKKK